MPRGREICLAAFVHLSSFQTAAELRCSNVGRHGGAVPQRVTLKLPLHCGEYPVTAAQMSEQKRKSRAVGRHSVPQVQYPAERYFEAGEGTKAV
jgi:hypothetical protein